MADLPDGPLPNGSALKARVRAILEEVGVAALIADALCERLQDEYKINMKSHAGALNLIVHDVMRGPATRVALAKVVKASAAPALAGRVANRKKAKRWRKKRTKAKRQKASAATKKNAPQRALTADVIFDNERRPAIVAAILAKGEAVDVAVIGDQIAALWRTEPDKMKYSLLAQKDEGRYADEKAAFDWEDAAAAQPIKKKTATPKQRAAAFEDAAQTPDWAFVSAAAVSVYSYAVGYLEPFLVPVGGGWADPKMARNHRTRWAALRLLAAGRGPLRAPTCNHTLRVASSETAPGKASLRRALLLLGPGELQEFRTTREDTEGTYQFMLSMLVQEAAVHDAPVWRALASLRVFKGENVTMPLELIRLLAANLTELECYDLDDACDDTADSVLPRCTRLESLAMFEWWGCPPAAWLGLSQLHTLRGVSLRDVPAAAIAASLPRLHTLHLCHGAVDVDFSVAAFFDELLPRLRSFHLEGPWPETSHAPESANVRPLPLLEDLRWWCRRVNNIPRQFMGARPSTLDASDVDLVEWLQAAVNAGPDPRGVTSPLARVRALTLNLRGAPPDTPFMALLLRATPQLRQLTFGVFHRDQVLWVVSDEFTPAPVFAGLVHRTLRHVVLSSHIDVPVPGGCGVRLRQHHFPRLRRFRSIRCGFRGVAKHFDPRENFLSTYNIDFYSIGQKVEQLSFFYPRCSGIRLQ
jgi:hypothetical protein